MLNLFKKRLDLSLLDAFTGAGHLTIRDNIGDNIKFDDESVSALSIAAVLYGLSMIAGNRVHQLMDEYYIYATHKFLTEKSEGSIERFYEAWNLDIKNGKQTNWIPKNLQAEIFCRIFGFNAGLINREDDEQLNEARIRSMQLTVVFSEIVKEIAKYKV